MKLKEETEELWNRYHFTPQQALSQNFLIDPHIIERIIDATEAGKNDLILEIGAGTGLLTRRLTERAGCILAVEIDELLCQILREELKEKKNLEVIQRDICQLSWERRKLSFRSVKVVGNLPYHLASSILLKLIREKWVKFMVVMLQREVGERLLSPPGSRRRGVMTVLLSHFGHLSKIIDVPPQAFIPRPKVSSSLFKITPQDTADLVDENLFARVVKAAFSARRKMLINSFAQALGLARAEVEQILISSGINPRRRAEQLTVEEFVKLSIILSKERSQEKIGY